MRQDHERHSNAARATEGPPSKAADGPTPATSQGSPVASVIGTRREPEVKTGQIRTACQDGAPELFEAGNACCDDATLIATCSGEDLFTGIGVLMPYCLSATVRPSRERREKTVPRLNECDTEPYTRHLEFPSIHRGNPACADDMTRQRVYSSSPVNNNDDNNNNN
ncbi:hypothetical protein LZ30DRAFT_107161 [Colletotrichum cereale]|nr:hypothetical protein LZ30DRAFT_107161 [Colletotrichum cereale]